jgi:hypothetical protein
MDPKLIVACTVAFVAWLEERPGRCWKVVGAVTLDCIT